MGEATSEKVVIARKADKIVRMIGKSSLREKLWQYFAFLTDTKATGIQATLELTATLLRLGLLKAAKP
jgi:GMP synthase (glutamine-hydrolysing)